MSINYFPFLDCGNEYNSYDDYVKDNLILDLNGFDEPIDNYWNDNSNYNHQSYIYGSSYKALKKAYYFDGIDDYIRIPNNPVFYTDEYGEFSYSITFNAYGLSERASLLSKTYPCNNPGIFDFFISSGFLSFGFYSNYDYKLGYFYGTEAIEENYFYNVVWTRKWGEVSTKLYVNGVLSEITYDNNFRGTYNYIQPIYIGARNGDGLTCQSGEVPDKFFNGLIYDIKIYNKILSEDEVQNNYLYLKNIFGIK